jgi:hypothetical protein
MKLTKCSLCNDIKNIIKFNYHPHPYFYSGHIGTFYVNNENIIYSTKFLLSKMFSGAKKICDKYKIILPIIFGFNNYNSINDEFNYCLIHTIYIYNQLMMKKKLIKVNKNDYNNYYKSHHFDLFLLYHAFYKYRTDEYIHPYLNWLNDFYVIRYSYKHKYILL